MSNLNSNAVLGQASREWSSRPADQSFLSLDSLHSAVAARTVRAKEAVDVPYSTLRVEAQDGDVKLLGKNSVPASFTHWSFGQLASAVGAPAGYLRGLPATLAAQNLNHGLKERGDDAGMTKLLLDGNGHWTVRALTGPDYSRIWDEDITRRVLELTKSDPTWQPMPETTMPNGALTRGLYASDHDIFIGLVDNDRRIFEKAPGGGLSRGFMIANSEVGDKSFWFLTFLYAYVCANHNIWGVDGVKELRIRHVGNADARSFDELRVELRKYSESSADVDEAQIRRCMMHEIAATKDELLDKLFGMKSVGLSRKQLERGYELAEIHEDWYGSPRSAWGIGNGLTEAAKEIVYQDQRVKMQRAASKVMSIAF